MKLVSILDAARDRNRIAMVARGRSWTRGEVSAAVAAMIDILGREGVTRGQRLLVIHEHDAQAVFLLAAASAIGLQLVMPYSLEATAAREWAAIAVAARPDRIIDLRSPEAAAGRTLPLPADIVWHEARRRHTPPDCPAIIVESPDPIQDFIVLFTSGTTGDPKAISISEELVCRRIASVSARLGFDADARVFMTGLLNNTTGILFSFGSLAHEATLFFPHGRDIAGWPAQIAGQRLTHMMLRPQALRRFLEGVEPGAPDLSSLRVVAYGAAAMPGPLLEAARRRMPCDWVQGYGLSETFGPFCWLTEADHRAGLHARHVHCVGTPDDTIETRIDAPAPGGIGELLVRGPGLMRGYIDGATGRVAAIGGWFRTGDYARRASTGELVLKGRIGGTILTANGHRIYPEEVEGVLVDIAGVTETLLLALPGERAPGEIPVACVHGPLAFEDMATIRKRIAAALAEGLSREKWPSHVFASRVPFPRNQNEKIDRRAVANGLAAAALIDLAAG